MTKKVLGDGRHEHGIYILSPTFQALLTTTSKLRASFELWHIRLGHANYDTISILNKTGCLSVTSIFPKLGVCSSCEISKQHRLPFVLNAKRASHVLDMFIVIYGDPHLFYLCGFSQVLKSFLAFVQTQFSTKLNFSKRWWWRIYQSSSSNLI